MINNDSIIVSMTSYPPRIKYVYDAYKSILNQSLNRELYHCVLVLAEPEFPNKEKDLPAKLLSLINQNNIEIIWHPTNIKSHKKLIPTLLKYPDNPILITDDDVIRENDWLETFYNDHIKYPNDIICGTFSFYFDDKLKVKRFKGGFKNSNIIPSLVFKNAKPANGLGGILYPSNTFQRKEFFDESLIMKLSELSDESWQYCFNIMENKTIRQTSKVFNNFKNLLDGSQEIPTSLHKVNNYDVINENLFSYFPEYKEKLNKNSKKVIVSLTSYPKRFKFVPTVIKSILEQTDHPYKICLTVFKDDLDFITKDIQKLIDDKVIELIIAPLNLKCHLKYFYVMQKYRTYPIITVDDDIIYEKDTISSLITSFRNNPNVISARRCHKITKITHLSIASYNNWNWMVKDEEPSDALFATGVGGVLYPPDILNISDENLPEIHSIINADDVYLKALELRKGIKVKYAKSSLKKLQEIKDPVIKETGLNKDNVHNFQNDKYIRMLKFNTLLDIKSLEEKKKKVASTIKTLPVKKVQSSTFINTYTQTTAKTLAVNESKIRISDKLPKKGNTNIKVALCCILKMENNYLLEWINHYKELGIDNIIMYDNNDIEGEYKEDIRDIPEIAKLIDEGYIIHHKIPGEVAVQVKYYNICYQQYSKDYDWIMFLDIDEFLQIDPILNCNTIQEYLSLNIYEKYNCIHLNWKLYDDNDLIHVIDNDYSIKDRFTRELTKTYPNKNYLNKEIKSIVRTNIRNVKFAKSPHTMEGSDIHCCNSIGQTVKNDQKSQTIVHKYAWINHYICKTLEEFINIKLIRKGGHTKHEKGLRYSLNFFFSYNKRTSDKTDYIKSLIEKEIITPEIMSYTNNNPSVKKAINEPVKKIQYGPNVIKKTIETKKISSIYKSVPF